MATLAPYKFYTLQRVVMECKQDVWIEYVVSITKKAYHLEQRMEKTTLSKFDEGYVKINIVRQVVLLHALEKTAK